MEPFDTLTLAEKCARCTFEVKDESVFRVSFLEEKMRRLLSLADCAAEILASHRQ